MLFLFHCNYFERKNGWDRIEGKKISVRLLNIGKQKKKKLINKISIQFILIILRH